MTQTHEKHTHESAPRPCGYGTQCAVWIRDQEGGKSTPKVVGILSPHAHAVPQSLAEFRRILSAGARLMLVSYETYEDGGLWHPAPHKYLGEVRSAVHVGSGFAELEGGSRLTFDHADSWRFVEYHEGRQIEATQTIEDDNAYGVRLTYLILAP